MTLLFLKKDDDSDHHAILNTNTICFMEGADPTDEWPGGTKTKILFGGGGVILHTPYKVIADQIAKAIEQGYVLSAQLNEAHRKAAVEDNRKMMMEVMEPFHHNHD